jgi:hypothetical protein
MSNKKSSSLAISDRRKKIADFFRKNPYSTQEEAAKILKIPQGSLQNDVRELTKMLDKESVGSFYIHRSRILQDIDDIKRECIRKLKLCRGATAGTRWVEEWTKLTKQEAKILGLYAPERAMSVVAHVDGRDGMTKEKRDAVVEAILIGDREGVIKVGADAESGEDRSDRPGV